MKGRKIIYHVAGEEFIRLRFGELAY